METRIYRRQHEQILRQLNAIDSLGPAASPWQFRHELQRLASLVHLHCAALQGSLYPRLAQHERDEIRATARDCAERITTCGDRVREFVTRWDDETIHRARTTFLEEYYAVRDAMREHIASERADLLDRVDPQRRPIAIASF